MLAPGWVGVVDQTTYIDDKGIRHQLSELSRGIVVRRGHPSQLDVQAVQLSKAKGIKNADRANRSGYMSSSRASRKGLHIHLIADIYHPSSSTSSTRVRGYHHGADSANVPSRTPARAQKE